MKVEAPEKIYIPITEGQEIAINEWGSIPLSQYEHKRVVENIEYTRADAFIEKACVKLKKLMLGYGFAITDNITHANYDKEQLVEDFKNYMKGE